MVTFSADIRLQFRYHIAYEGRLLECDWTTIGGAPVITTKTGEPDCEDTPP